MIRRSILMLLCATLTGCGGGASSTISPVAPSVTQASAAVRGALVVHIPNRTGTTSSALRRAQYVSASTQSAWVQIDPVAGCTQCSPPVTLKAALTPSSAGCTTNANGTTCTIALRLLAGSYTAAMSTYDGPLDAQGTPTGLRLSANDAFPIAIAVGSQNLVGVSLSAIPTSLKLTPQTANIYRGGTIVGNSVVPALRILGANAVGKVLITAYDADGNAIAGTGTPTGFNLVSSGGFTTSVAGNVATITAPATLTTTTYGLTATAGGPGCAEPEAQCSTSTPFGFEQLLAITDAGVGIGAVFLIPVDSTTPAPIATITSGLNGASNVVFAPDGTLFVSNFSGGRVTAYAPPYTGAPTAVTSGIAGPRGMVFAPNGTLLVADKAGAHVTVLPPPYTASTTLPVTDAEGFAFDAAGTVYISDFNNNAIVSANAPYTALNGNPLSGSATKLNNPMGLAFNANGELWVANFSGNTLGRFKQLSGNAAPSATISVGGTAQPTAVAVVKGGTTLVAIGQGLVASFDEGTQAVLVQNSSIAGSAASKITLDLAGTAWFATFGQQYYGLAYPYTSSQALYSLSGAPLKATADIAVFP
jgi:sugar lactone lactonase YvrE